MNSRSGFAPIIIIIVAVVLLGIGAGGFVLISKSKTSSPPTSSQASQTEIPPATLPSGQTSETKTSQSPPLTKRAVVSTDPKLLEGLWKIEIAYEWVNPPGIWKESEELKARITYQEFRNGEMCSEWPLRIFEPLTGPPTLKQALDKMYCGKYKPYRTLTASDGYKPKDKDVSAITFSGERYGPIYEWKMVNGKLEFGSPGGKGTYVKIPGTRDLVAEPKDTEKPKITLFKASSQSVKTSGEITLTCSATDNSGSAQIAFDIAGLIEGGTANASEVGPFRSNGDPFIFAYKPPFAGNYTATCKVSDKAQNKIESAINFSVSQ